MTISPSMYSARISSPSAWYSSQVAVGALAFRWPCRHHPTNVRPRQDSNLRSRLRRAVLYPLSYGGPGVFGPKETVPVVFAGRPIVLFNRMSWIGHVAEADLGRKTWAYAGLGVAEADLGRKTWAYAGLGVAEADLGRKTRARTEMPLGPGAGMHSPATACSGRVSG